MLYPVLYQRCLSLIRMRTFYMGAQFYDDVTNIRFSCCEILRKTWYFQVIIHSNYSPTKHYIRNFASLVEFRIIYQKLWHCNVESFFYYFPRLFCSVNNLTIIIVRYPPYNYTKFYVANFTIITGRIWF